MGGHGHDHHHEDEDNLVCEKVGVIFIFVVIALYFIAV